MFYYVEQYQNFIIYASVLLSKFVVDEYKNKTMSIMKGSR